MNSYFQKFVTRKNNVWAKFSHTNSMLKGHAF